MEAHRSDTGSAEERAAPRFTLLIRAAKLVAPQGQFVCVIRDVSSTGVSLRGFLPLPEGDGLMLELQTGERHAIERIWERGVESGYRFLEIVEVSELLSETGEYPKRQLRLDVEVPIYIRSSGQAIEARLTNLSQQGARIECPYLLAIEQPLRLMSSDLPEISAKVRWRERSCYGLVFDTTFNLREIALLGARLQAPELVPPGAA